MRRSFATPTRTPWKPLSIKHSSPFRPLPDKTPSQPEFNPLCLDILEFGGLRPPSLRRKYPITEYPVIRQKEEVKPEQSKNEEPSS